VNRLRVSRLRGASPTIRPGRSVDPWLLALVSLVTIALYARFLDGFWLGDDYANLARAWLADEAGTLWRDVVTQFVTPAHSEGAFYRPLQIASLYVNAWIAGQRYAGWFAFNLALHVANVVLVGMLAMRLANACGADGRWSGAAAALFFALCPALAEGVFWVSARADASVALLTLAGLYAWTTARTPAAQALVLPLLLVPALGFKEAAAVMPFQMTLVALAWPQRPSRARIVAIVLAFALIGAFLALRAALFGSFWQVYGYGAGDPLLGRFLAALTSIAPWWSGLTRTAPVAGIVYPAVVAAAVAFIALAASGPAARLALALFGAAAGIVAATLLNLGSMHDSGEGGRLTYGATAWLALALGVGGARPLAGESGRMARRRTTGGALVVAAATIGAFVLNAQLAHARNAEGDMRALVRALPAWADGNPGLTLLLVPDQDGPVVTAHNAQGGIVLPPMQREPLLHRVLPTVPSEIPLRYTQLAGGIATRLAALRPARVDAATLAQLGQPDVPRWPDAYACWSPQRRRIVALPAPDPADRSQWTSALSQVPPQCWIGR
jgi:hypothetical protein